MNSAAPYTNDYVELFNRGSSAVDLSGWTVQYATAAGTAWTATPPNPPAQWMFSCPPEQLIDTYNQCLTWAREASITLDAYLFWGAEYWLLRAQSGDKAYLNAFARILENA